MLTSVGYGIGIGGIAALLTMLQFCSPGPAVVKYRQWIWSWGIGCFGRRAKRKLKQW